MKKKNWTWSTLRPSFRCKHKQSFIDKFGLCSYYFFLGSVLPPYVASFVSLFVLENFYSGICLHSQTLQVGFKWHSDFLAWLDSATLRYLCLAELCHTHEFSIWLKMKTLPKRNEDDLKNENNLKNEDESKMKKT